jgi:hypothetical protein
MPKLGEPVDDGVVNRGQRQCCAAFAVGADTDAIQRLQHIADAVL